MAKWRTDHGAVLAIVVVSALVCSVLAYGALYLAMAKARRAQALQDRAQARYAAEAATVWAMQQLWSDATWSAPGGVNIAGTVAIPGIRELTVILPVCPAPPAPCSPRPLTVIARN